MKTPMQTIRERKQVLVNDLNTQMGLVNDLVTEFYKETGLPVGGFSVRIFNVTEMGGKAEYVHGGAEVDYGE